MKITTFPQESGPRSREFRVQQPAVWFGRVAWPASARRVDHHGPSVEQGTITDPQAGPAAEAGNVPAVAGPPRIRAHDHDVAEDVTSVDQSGPAIAMVSGARELPERIAGEYTPRAISSTSGLQLGETLAHLAPGSWFPGHPKHS